MKDSNPIAPVLDSTRQLAIRIMVKKKMQVGTNNPTEQKAGKN